MKRAIFGFLSLFFVFIVGVKTTFANEGVVNLRGEGSGSCFAASIFIDGSYRILMTCRELKIALSPERNRYVAWVEGEDTKQKRLGEIVNGKLSVLTDVKFTKIFVTSEEDSYGNKPLGDILLTGAAEPIDFGKGVIISPSITTPTPTVSQPVKVTTTKAVTTPKVTNTSTGTTSSSGLGSALSTIFKIALFGFGLLLVVVGVFSFLQRRRSL